MKYILFFIFLGVSIYPQDYTLLIINSQSKPINCFIAATAQDGFTEEWVPPFDTDGKMMVAKNHNHMIVLSYLPAQLSFSIIPSHEVSFGQFSFQYKIKPKKNLEFLDVGNINEENKESLRLPIGTFNPASVSKWTPPSKNHLKRLFKINN